MVARRFALSRLWPELRRRKVVRAAGIYAAAAVAVIAAANDIFPPLQFPAWTLTFVVVLTLLGLPVALALAWGYELRPEAHTAATANTRPEVSATEGTARAEQRPGVVVLPFDNLSPDPGDVYFSGGLTEEIITCLSYQRGLRVISRISAITLKGTGKDTRTIGREPGAGYVLEGSVRKAGDALRITAQLIDAGRDAHPWVTREGQMRDCLLRRGLLPIVAAVAAALGPKGVPAQTPDLVLTGGKVFTADPARPWAQALAIRGERIVAVGSDREIVKLAGPATRRVDVAGRVVVPGFNDAHAHLGCHRSTATGPAPAAVSMANTSDDPFPDPRFATVADSLRALAARVPAGTWIGASVGETVLEDSTARRIALDRVAPQHPVWLGAWTGVGAIVNTRALRALGIDDTAADPLGGRYEREAGTGRVSGLLEGYAGFQAKQHLCGTEPESFLIAELQGEGRQFLRFGVTSVQNMANELEPALFMRAATSANLPVRLRMVAFPMTSPAGRTAPAWPSESETGAVTRNTAGGTVTMSGVKWLLEGTPIERLAVQRRAYRDRPGLFGRLYLPPDTIRALLLEARERREQPILHAGGDSTIALVLDLMERSAGAPPWKEVRVRLEHGDGLAPDLLARARRLGIVVVQNPSHLATPLISRRRFEPAVLAGLYPLRSIVEAGIPLALGSDGPTNPFLNIMFATTHPTRPEEALSREQAVVAYTRGSAYAEFAEGEKGTLAPGMLADLAVLSQDIFVVPPQALPATTSVLTIIGGRIVYDALTG